jgi:hypothetical protein
MSKFVQTGAALGLLALVACGPSFSSDRDPSIPIPASATWTWAGGHPDAAANDQAGASDITHRRIQVAIERELAEKGYRKVADAAEANFVVRYGLALKVSTEYQTTSVATGGYGGYGWGYGYGYGGASMSTTRPVEIREGAFRLELRSRATDQTAWWGMIQDVVGDTPPNEERIGQVVKATLKEMPVSKAN